MFDDIKSMTALLFCFIVLGGIMVAQDAVFPAAICGIMMGVLSYRVGMLIAMGWWE